MPLQDRCTDSGSLACLVTADRVPGSSTQLSSQPQQHIDRCPCPGIAGNRLIADMAVHLLQSTALELLATRPWGSLDEALLAASLSPPMHPDNPEQATVLCAHSGELQQYVATSQGFTYMVESTFTEKPVGGFSASVPGSSLELKVRSSTSVSCLA
jgi:hypothetical protein